MNIDSVSQDNVPREELALGKDGEDRWRLESFAFECSEYFHLANLSPISTLIYGLAFRLTKGGTNKFFPSAENIAEYFGRSPSQVRRGLKQLVKHGFLELLEKGKFRPNTYRVLSHRDWAAKHPGCCCTKLEFSFTPQGDPLGRELWVITGDRVRFQEFQINNLRLLGFTDAEIIEKFSRFWEEKGSKLPVQGVSPYFYQILETAARGEQE